MRFREWCVVQGVTVTSEQIRASRYLEKHGQHFCVEYGYANAVEKARELKRVNRAKAKRKRERAAKRKKRA